jgi:hypothetical protein
MFQKNFLISDHSNPNSRKEIWHGLIGKGPSRTPKLGNLPLNSREIARSHHLVTGHSPRIRIRLSALASSPCPPVSAFAFTSRRNRDLK